MQQLLERKCNAPIAVVLNDPPAPSLVEGSAPALRRHLPASACPERRRGASQPTDSPAGQNFGELLNILLRVAAVDAERVQFEQLARIVFVQASRLLSALATTAASELRASRARADRLKVVEVHQHRRMSGRCEHHVFEPAEHVRPDCFALVTAGEWRDKYLRASRHTQMIRPERDEPLDKRPVGAYPLGECGTALGCSDRHERPASLLSRLLARLLITRLREHAKG